MRQHALRLLSTSSCFRGRRISSSRSSIVYDRTVLTRTRVINNNRENKTTTIRSSSGNFGYPQSSNNSSSSSYGRSCRRLSSSSMTSSFNKDTTPNRVKVPELSVTKVATALGLVAREDTDTTAATASASAFTTSTRPIYIDCRSEEEQATGIVPGSINLPYPHNGNASLIEPQEWLDDIVDEVFHGSTNDRTTKTTPIFVGCRSGARAAMACAVLVRDGGYTNVTNVQGGMVAWSQANLPMVPYTG